MPTLPIASPGGRGPDATFRERDAVPLSVMPADVDTAAEWQDRHDLEYPVLADPNAQIGEAYDQPSRYAVDGRLHNLLGRLPGVVLLYSRGEEARLAFTYRGRSPGDRPPKDEVLSGVDDLRESYLFDCELVDC